MLERKMTVTMVDGAVHANVSPRPADLMAFERHFGVVISAGGGFSMEQLMYLAWRPLRRSEATLLDLDAWIDQVERIDVVSDEPPTPIPPAL